MLILVMGKNGSGKSAFAEALAVHHRETRYYIATMLPHGQEGLYRVERHKIQRAGMGFITLELPYAVGSADVSSDAAVLVEDVSNLLANVVFDRDRSAAEVLEDIKLLCRRVGCVIAVTISEFDDGNYSEETMGYIQALQWLNRQLFNLADIVVEMDENQPIYRKGAPDEIF
ncbi:MAG: bifunctional adenosylcobinamide kinase/adenosylcobinamide-phosphate guanylyltransferase [Syntrophomonadaceae bacterium]|nr:bifunctional adenosylcobinamide kinase/adenosylcobinamide-phosphate guanylyltransferase [Syntrophomonadaceae bacterium]